MEDIESAKSENSNIRRIQNKLLQWEIPDHPLAPLSTVQREIFFELSQVVTGSYEEFIRNEDFEQCSMQEFLKSYSEVEDRLIKNDDETYESYFSQLSLRSSECDALLKIIDDSVQALNELASEHSLVSVNTSLLNNASEHLLSDQNKLNIICNDICDRLQYFNQAEKLGQRLSCGKTLAVTSDSFIQVLNKIDECILYMKNHPNCKEAPIFEARYRHCLYKAITLIRNYVMQVLNNATDQVIGSKLQLQNGSDSFALFYGKFQTCIPKIKKIIEEVEKRCEVYDDYRLLLAELQNHFISQRMQIMTNDVRGTILNLCNDGENSSVHHGDHCALVRKSCAFLIHICQDEYRLFCQFFTEKSPQLFDYLHGLCSTLYDMLRPLIIHINHLETLAELCSILKVEMLDEHVQNNSEALEAFSQIVWQLLQDVQERLVFRAHLYLQTDILQYSPAPGDLAYPEKLEMMESIAQSLQEHPLRRSDSRSSISSTTSNTSQEVARINSDQAKSRLISSPADLHGMWYPTVRRTLVCLSRLYRCVDRPIFQGLSQEALSLCIQSVASAAQSISSKKTIVDGELFQIKHLLILREQIAPFQVDFTVKEMRLDFSKVKTAAFGLLQKRKQLFSLGTNNAILEFLLDGTPQVKEQLLDSRKDVDRQLKTSCENFIRTSTILLAAPLLDFNNKVATFFQNVDENKLSTTLKSQPWAGPKEIGAIVQETQKLMKARLAGLQRSLQLYLSNKDTEFILFRPIRNNVVGAFVKLEQNLNNGGYTSDEIIIAGCPTPEQVSVLLSSASLVAEGIPSQPHSKEFTRKISSARKELTVAEESPEIFTSQQESKIDDPE
ncbi:conserved oligomeric Golgi complex subunit 3-like [Ctenocephalides felis]|uniref:conserved oligomeric Golgi complex subunit 3-like n=2 Tax=Ctenocephalides felis TaxID=7515 RepID=UPI000E6E461A|nr:conserved oligomeric Golgi complex subunit 3-like [Ctenocephalides felis]